MIWFLAFPAALAIAFVIGLVAPRWVLPLVLVGLVIAAAGAAVGLTSEPGDIDPVAVAIVLAIPGLLFTAGAAAGAAVGRRR